MSASPTTRASPTPTVIETGQAAADFLSRAASWFAARGVPIERVMTDNALHLCQRFKCPHNPLRTPVNDTYEGRPSWH